MGVTHIRRSVELRVQRRLESLVLSAFAGKIPVTKNKTIFWWMMVCKNPRSMSRRLGRRGGGGEGRIELLVGKPEKAILEGPSRSMTSTLWASVAIPTFIRPYQGGYWVDLGVLGMWGGFHLRTWPTRKTFNKMPRLKTSLVEQR